MDLLKVSLITFLMVIFIQPGNDFNKIFSDYKIKKKALYHQLLKKLSGPVDPEYDPEKTAKKLLRRNKEMLEKDYPEHARLLTFLSIDGRLVVNALKSIKENGIIYLDGLVIYKSDTVYFPHYDKIFSWGEKPRKQRKTYDPEWDQGYTESPTINHR